MSISTTTKKITWSTGIIFFVFVTLFIWKIGLATSGPTLAVHDFAQSALTGEPLITVSGSTKGGKNVIINGTEKTIAPDGTFAYDILLQEGFNMITVSTIDRRGRTTTESFSLVLHNEGGRYAVADITHY